eukprot:6374060-Alexandrium_andersonii.AAC.1
MAGWGRPGWSPFSHRSRRSSVGPRPGFGKSSLLLSSRVSSQRVLGGVGGGLRGTSLVPGGGRWDRSARAV